MDFLEGFLMGPVWSDTEYETRRHTGFYWFIGWLFLTFFAYSVVYPERLPTWLEMPRYVPLVGFFLVALITPLICRYYYRMNIFVKLLILILLIAKYALGFVALFQFWRERINVDLSTAPADILEYINKTIAASTEYFSGLGDGPGMLVGIVAGGLLIVVVFAGGLLLATITPAIFLAVMKVIQRGIDELASQTVLRHLD
jgi:hypothetical protein